MEPASFSALVSTQSYTVTWDSVSLRLALRLRHHIAQSAPS
jgi:hypothetical protein